MSQENIETTRCLFKAVEDRDIAGVLAAYHPDIIIRDAESLPYGGVHRGFEGAKQHVEGAAKTWNHLQPAAERKMDAVFLDAEEYVIVLWRLRGLAANSRKLDLPVVSVYKKCTTAKLRSHKCFIRIRLQYCNFWKAVDNRVLGSMNVTPS